MEVDNAPPPTYDAVAPSTVHDLIKEVERLKQKTNTDPDFKQKVNDAFIALAGSEDYAKKILDDVDKFTQKIIQTNETFENIGSKFHDIDQQKLKGPDGKIWKFEDEWNGLRDQWKAFARQSQDTALKALSRAQELDVFCEGILKIGKAGDQRYKDTLTELGPFISKPDPEGRKYDPKDVDKQTKAHSKAHGQLMYDLTAFKAKYGCFSDFIGIEIGFEAAVLNAELAEVEAAILVDQRLGLALGVVLDVTTFTTLAGGVIVPAIGSLSIGGISTIVLGAVSVAGEASAFENFISELTKKETNSRDLANEIKDKEKSMKALETVKSVFENQARDTGFVISKLDLVKNTWLIINNEANLLYSELQKVVDVTTLTHFKDRVKSVSKAYSTMDAVLSKISNVDI